MKQALSKGFMLATFIVLSACDKGGGSDNKQQAQIPGPQGRIQAQGSANYCDFNNTSGSMICYGQQNSFNGAQACNTGTQSYTDIATLCRQLQTQMQTQMSACYVSDAVNLVYSQQNCAALLGQQTGLNQTGTLGNMPVSTDPNFKTVQCEFEAFRVSQGRWIRRENRTPKLTAMMMFDGRMQQTMDLRSKFLGFDIGSFGSTKMIFSPANAKNPADMIKLTNQGLNDTMTLSQSGFAGQAVKMDLTSDDGQMKLSVSCAGQTGSQFKKLAVARTYTKYVCTGTSSLYGSHREDINVSFPYDSSLLNSELSLGSNLTATVTGDTTGADSARITFTANGIGTDVSLVSSANLKAKSELKATDGLTNVELTCGPQ